MASKQVNDRLKSSRAVVAAAETNANEIAAGFQQTLSPYLEKGEAMPDVALLVKLTGRWIAAETRALEKADQVNELELRDDATPREARDEAAADVRRTLVDLRSAAEATFGPAGLRKLAIAEAVPSDAQAILTKAREVLSALQDQTIKMPKALRRGMKMDRSAFAEDLSEDMPALEKALATVAREQREADKTLAAKRAALESNDWAFMKGAAWLTSSAALARLEALAEKVRPSGRRPGETAENADENAAESPGEAEG